MGQATAAVETCLAVALAVVTNISKASAENFLRYTKTTFKMAFHLLVVRASWPRKRQQNKHRVDLIILAKQLVGHSYMVVHVKFHREKKISR